MNVRRLSPFQSDESDEPGNENPPRVAASPSPDHWAVLVLILIG